MSEPAGKTALKPVYGWLPLVYFVIQVIVGVWLAFWLLYNHQPQTGDDIEHLHSAWLVHEGKIPYIDFFQHHNPLLWYLFSPLAGYFAYDLVLFDVVRIISTVVMFASLYVAALIVKRFMVGNWYAGVLCIASVFPSYVIFSGQDFRPDNYMVLMFMLGLYWFLPIWNVGSLGIWCCPLWRCLPLSCLCRKSFFYWPFLLRWFFISCMSAEFLFGIF